ncbi:hypothetical protein D9Q98_003616 [Chlorella vulgaris]|uniref:Protein HGH1 N-terminal domain-containing protein n=1 Tax=Chlorella vulgaris TaxID=3077 RepID=A0A9D4TT32_CHLVU|nr:hypothetical protein D9Q98_003616 [Chlorella vulgaris]
MASELEDLVNFLSDSRPAIQQHAVDLVQGLTGSPDGIAQLGKLSAKLLPSLFRLVPCPEAVSRPALVALVNLSQEPSVQQQLLGLNALARCMDYLREGSCAGREELLVMLLANLTSLEAGAEALLQMGRGALEGLNAAMLIKLLLDPPGQQDAYAHVATVLPNLTRFPSGRRLLLQPGRGLLLALASQLRSRSELRRRGCAGAIKNCCFSCEQDGTVMDIAAETEALTTVLDVLCGITAKEADEAVREALAEAVLCLARVDAARKQLWACDAPGMLKTGYEFEENRTVCACMEATAELFLSDGFEPQPEEGGAQLGGGGGGGGWAGVSSDEPAVSVSKREVSIEEVD